MRVLELFAGTGSVGDVCRRLGHEVISLDRDLHADIEVDIMDWDYRTYQPKHFDFIWASPPCQEYSKAKTKGVSPNLGLFRTNFLGDGESTDGEDERATIHARSALQRHRLLQVWHAIQKTN